MKHVSLLLSITLAACHVEPPAMPDEDAARRRHAKSAGRTALAERAALAPTLTEAEQRRATAAAAVSAAEAQHQAEVDLATASAREVTAYESALVEVAGFAAFCANDVDPKRLVQVHASLAKYVSEPRRDAALGALEPCRKHASRYLIQVYRDVSRTLRTDYARTVEDQFDEDNPYSRSKLVAVVKGDTLSLRMRGNFEGRARHSQEQVDMWCDGASSLFTFIVLRNSHGTFSCRPHQSPEGTVQALLADAGVSSPWTPPPTGDRPTPHRLVPPPPPPPGASPLQDQLTRAQTDLASIEAASAALDTEAERARATIRSVDDKQETRESAWRDSMQDSAKRVTGAGVGFVIAGSVATGLGAYSGYLRSETQANIEAIRLIGEPSSATTDKLAAQTGGMIAGLAIGLPLVAVGALLLLVGKRRKDASRSRISVGPHGLLMHF